MKKTKKTNYTLAAALLAAFALWTLLVMKVDVRPIGPEGSAVGFAALNRFAHQLTGVHLFWYELTDWLSLLPVALALGFALLGFLQLCRRKSLRKVDKSLLALGGVYLAAVAAYLFFEVFVVNRRPVLLAGVLEASYPSSTTVLVLCIMPTAALQLKERFVGRARCRQLAMAAELFAVFMVLARLVSGVHWVTDIIGGLLLSAGLVFLYRGITE